MRLKGFIYSLGFLISCFLILFIAGAVITGLIIQNFEIPQNFGNGQENIANVCKNMDANDFTFIVVGDVKDGTATFEAMLDIIEQEDPAFTVVLGDLVCKATGIAHKLFTFEMSEHCREVPMFIVAGNHDIDLEGGFDITDFEKIYGPAQFSFCIGEYLFVFLNDNEPYCDSEDYIEYLESAILSRQGKIKKTFVFMHVPAIKIDGSLQNSGLSGSERFMELAKEYNIDYVFAGDHHGYIKQHVGNTNYIITGGGGSRLRGQRGRFYHMMRIGVEEGLATETVILGRKYIETTELIERNIVIYIWPMISHNMVSRFVTAIILIFAFLMCIYTFRKRRNLKKRRI